MLLPFNIASLHEWSKVQYFFSLVFFCTLCCTLYLNKALACYVVIDGLRKIYENINVEQKSVHPLFADSLLISHISLLVKSYPIQ